MSLLQRPNSKNCSKLLKPVPQLSQPSQLPQLLPQSFHTEDTTVTTSEDTTVLDITVMLDTHTAHMLVITVHMLVMLVIHSVTFPTNSWPQPPKQNNFSTPLKYTRTPETT